MLQVPSNPVNDLEDGQCCVSRRLWAGCVGPLVDVLSSFFAAYQAVGVLQVLTWFRAVSCFSPAPEPKSTGKHIITDQCSISCEQFQVIGELEHGHGPAHTSASHTLA